VIDNSTHVKELNPLKSRFESTTARAKQPVDVEYTVTRVGSRFRRRPRGEKRSQKARESYFRRFGPKRLFLGRRDRFRHFAAIGDPNLGRSSTRSTSQTLHFLHDLQSFDNLTEDDVSPI